MLKDYDEEADFYATDGIPASKLRNARTSCEVPADEEILILINSTVFGSAKNALLVGMKGIYCHNDWSSRTDGAFHIPWSDFIDIELEADELEVKVGKSIWFCVAGCSMNGEKLVSLLERLRQLILGNG